MKIVTYNILYGGQERLPLITQLLRDQHPDLVALQEANDRRAVEQLADALNMHLLFGEANSTFHVAWLSRWSVSFVRNYQLAVLHKTLLRIDVPWNGETLHLCTTHLRAGYADEHEACRLGEIEAILGEIQPMLAEPLLLVGDLNAFAPDDLVASLPIGEDGVADRRFIETRKRLVIARLREVGLLDCYRVLHPTEAGYTCDARRGPSMRIDYCFASQALAPFLSSCEVIQNNLTPKASDHLPVQVEFADQ